MVHNRADGSLVSPIPSNRHPFVKTGGMTRIAVTGYGAVTPGRAGCSVLLAVTPGGKHAIKWANGLYLEAAAAAFGSSPSSDLGGQLQFLGALVKALDAATRRQRKATAG
jgi:hypothetical protein